MHHGAQLKIKEKSSGHATSKIWKESIPKEKYKKGQHVKNKQTKKPCKLDEGKRI